MIIKARIHRVVSLGIVLVPLVVVLPQILVAANEEYGTSTVLLTSMYTAVIVTTKIIFCCQL